MRNVGTIAGKELRHTFYSPVAWLVMAGFLFVNGFVFLFITSYYERERPNDPPVRILFGEEGNGFFWFLLLIVVPAITMRLFPEERTSGTIEPLMTAPVTDAEVVLGKYLAAVAFFAILWAPTLLFVGLLYHYASPDTWSTVLDGFRPWSPASWRASWGRLNEIMDMGPIATAYLGTIAMGASWIGIGLLASACTRNQIVAFIATFVVLLLLFTIGWLGQIVPSDWDIAKGVKEVTKRLSFHEQLPDFRRGVIDTRPLLYFASVIALTLFAAVRVVEARRWK